MPTTRGKAARRFFMSLFRKRGLLTDADLADLASVGDRAVRAG